MTAARVTGGCQCGAVRFSAPASAVRRASVCHCRMCQRAVGNLFAPLVELTRAAVSWERGAPALYASSNISERGFCAACGTPLFLQDIGGDVIEMMIGALDRPNDFPPAYHYGVESRVAWLEGMAALPGYETGAGPEDAAPGLGERPRIVSLQAPVETNE